MPHLYSPALGEDGSAADEYCNDEHDQAHIGFLNERCRRRALQTCLADIAREKSPLLNPIKRDIASRWTADYRFITATKF